MANQFFRRIVVAMLLGVVAGAAVHSFAPASAVSEFAAHLKIVTDVFLRLISMIIAPLVLTTLIAGIAHMGDSQALGRVGARTIGWFLGASLFSLLLGLLMVNLLQPGAGFELKLSADAAVAPDAEGFSLAGFITHLAPRSVFEALAENEILQIVVFSVFAGVSLGAMRDRVPQILALVEQGAALVLRITNYVMLLSPFAVFAAIAGVVAVHGLAVLITYSAFVGSFYLSLIILWVALILAGRVVIGARTYSLIRGVREPILLAFSTASSEAAYPRLLEQLERFGASNRIASFVLPLGYSFNLDGSMMYCSFAVVFIAQAYGVELSVIDQISMMLLMMITSKGMAAVPRASLVVVAATLSFLDLPQEGLLLLLAIDHFLDMGRSGTNIVGNSIATAAVAKWEGELSEQADGPEHSPLARVTGASERA